MSYTIAPFKANDGHDCMEMCCMVPRGRQCMPGLLASVIAGTLLLITACSHADNFRNILSADNVLAMVLSASDFRIRLCSQEGLE